MNIQEEICFAREEPKKKFNWNLINFHFSSDYISTRISREISNMNSRKKNVSSSAWAEILKVSGVVEKKMIKTRGTLSTPLHRGRESKWLTGANCDLMDTGWESNSAKNEPLSVCQFSHLRTFWQQAAFNELGILLAKNWPFHPWPYSQHSVRFDVEFTNHFFKFFFRCNFSCTSNVPQRIAARKTADCLFSLFLLLFLLDMFVPSLVAKKQPRLNLNVLRKPYEKKYYVLLEEQRKGMKLWSRNCVFFCKAESNR